MLEREVKLVPPIYVKPFVKRQKYDAADAEAIVEVASRPTIRFVRVKTVERQGQGMLFRMRDPLVRQRTQSINALRRHLAEFGIIAAQAPHGSSGCGRPSTTRRSRCRTRYASSPAFSSIRLRRSARKLALSRRDIRWRVPKDAQNVRLMSIPGVGALSATAVHAFCPSMTTFQSGRDFAAWVGLTPRQDSTG